MQIAMTQDLVDRIMGATLGISRTLRQKMACKADEHGNMLQIHALVHIREKEGMTMKEMADYLKITSPSATSFVNRLVKLGWVQRITDAKNRKLVRLKVSPAGMRMLESKMAERKAEMRQVLSLLPSQDQKDLARILSTLSTALESAS
jgi:DNA-binding MarR family transcriptional regulator